MSGRKIRGDNSKGMNKKFQKNTKKRVTDNSKAISKTSDDGRSSYKYHFVSPPPDDVICPLCLDIVEEPHQFTCCGQHICRKCRDELVQQVTTPRCPMCRHNEYIMSPDKYFERNVLNKLWIWCTEGCGQEIELGQLKNHLLQCPWIQEDCPYGCGQQFRRWYIEDHKEECLKRPFDCHYCGYHSTHEVIVNEHHPICDKYPINCPNECCFYDYDYDYDYETTMPIERGMLKDHLDKCPLQMVECEFSHVGCQEKVHRCNLAQHLSDNSLHHNALSSKMIYESLQKTMEEKDRQILEKDKQLQEKDKQLQEKDKQLQEKDRQVQEKDKTLDLLLSEVHELREKNMNLEHLVGNIHDKICDNVVLLVTMEKFRHKKEHKVHWFSPPYSHPLGYKMCFEVDFNSDKKSLCIYSYIKPGPYDDHLRWPFEWTIIVRLLNQCGDYHHYDYVFDYKDMDEGNRVITGEREPWLETQSSRLLLHKLDYDADTKCQYLKNDCLKFEVIIPPQLECVRLF